MTADGAGQQGFNKISEELDQQTTGTSSDRSKESKGSSYQETRLFAAAINDEEHNAGQLESEAAYKLMAPATVEAP